MKRILLPICLCLCVAGCGGKTDKNTAESSFSYEINMSQSKSVKPGVLLPYEIDKTGCITRFYGTDDNSQVIEVPSSYSIDSEGKIVTGNSFMVKRIGDYCFANNQLVKTVVIPEPIEDIGEYAFYDCPLLSTIVIPSSVRTIGNGAFDRCVSIKKIVGSGNGGMILAENDNLSKFVIPETVTSIESQAFVGWDNLNSLSVPENVIKISSKSISNCKSIKAVVINGSITELDENSFKDCPQLTTLTFVKIPKITKFTVPLSVSSIGQKPFYGWENLIELNLHENFSLSTGMFNNNYNLRKITCKNFQFFTMFSTNSSSTQEVDERMYEVSISNLSNTYKYVFPKALKEVVLLGREINSSTGDYIETNCFSRMDSLESITIPVKVKRFDSGSFYGLKNLKTVYFSTNSDWTYYYSNSWSGTSDTGTISKETMNSPTGLANAIKEHFVNSEYRWSAKN